MNFAATMGGRLHVYILPSFQPIDIKIPIYLQKRGVQKNLGVNSQKMTLDQGIDFFTI